MKWKNTGLRTRLYIIAAIVLLVGLGSACLIYLSAEDDQSRVSGYEISGGEVYPVSPEQSKAYIHDLEVYGGRANVLADELARWFTGLWHGKSLAYTVACITFFISFFFFFFAYHLPAESTSDVRDKDDPGGDA